MLLCCGCVEKSYQLSFTDLWYPLLIYILLMTLVRFTALTPGILVSLEVFCTKRHYFSHEGLVEGCT